MKPVPVSALSFLRRLWRRLAALGDGPFEQEATIQREAEAARWMVKHTGASNAAE